MPVWLWVILAVAVILIPGMAFNFIRPGRLYWTEWNDAKPLEYISHHRKSWWDVH